MAKGGASNTIKGKNEGMLIDLGNDSTTTKSNNQVKIIGLKQWRTRWFTGRVGGEILGDIEGEDVSYK